MRSFSLRFTSGMFFILVMVIELAFVALARFAPGYGADVAGGFGGWRVNPAVLLAPVGFAVPMLLAMFVTRDLKAVAIVAAGILSQMLAHSNYLMNAHYLHPAILVTVGATVLSLHALRRKPRLLSIALAALALSFVVSYRSPIDSARTWAEDGERFQAAMRAIATENAPIVTIDAPPHFEYAVSTETWLRYYGYTGEITFED